MINSKIFSDSPQVILMGIGFALVIVSLSSLFYLPISSSWILLLKVASGVAGVIMIRIGYKRHSLKHKEENEAAPKSAGDGLAEMSDSIAKAMERR